MTTNTTTERDRWFLGTFLRILANTSDTGGQLGLMEQVAPQGFSPPLHVHHREDTALLPRLVDAIAGYDAEIIGPPLGPND